jgi:hypothetical protein
MDILLKLILKAVQANINLPAQGECSPTTQNDFHKKSRSKISGVLETLEVWATQ